MLGTQKDHCSMQSAQLPDAASSQAWSTAAALGLRAGWYMRRMVLLSLAPEGLAFAGLFGNIQQAHSVRKGLLHQSRLSSVGPYELVSVGVCR